MTQHYPPSPPLDSFDEILNQARHLFQEGRPMEAEPLCLAILQIQSDHPEAHYLLGLLSVGKGQENEGLAHFEAAIDKRPEHGPYWLAYIDTLDQTGHPEAARQMLEMAQQIGLTGKEVDSLAARLAQHPLLTIIDPPDDSTPDQQDIDTLISLYQQDRTTDCEEYARLLLNRFPVHGLSWKVLGAVLQQQHRTEEAIAAMRQAVLMLPEDPDSWNNLGIILKSSGNLDESEKILRHAITLRGNFAEAHNNLGVTLMSQGRLSESEEHLRQAMHLQPDYTEAFCNLGINLKTQGRLAEAAESLQHALQINPSYAEAHNNLGNLLQGQGRLSEAEAHLNKALELKPDFAVAWNNLANILHCQGRLTYSQSCYHKALTLKPDYSEAFDGLLFASNYHPDASNEDLFQLYREYDRQFGLPLQSQWRSHTNSKNCCRILKIGYVSPSFYKHPVLHFLEPLLANHDKNKFEIFAYSETVREDQSTLSYRQYVDHWLTTTGLSDDELTQQIRDDGIDILVDLAGHTSNNRLSVFARKAAPVSLHWLDFGYTTGLSAIDYYLTDINNAPLGSEHLFSEQLWRLPSPAFAYRPAQGMGKVNSLPALHRKYITFGTLTRAIRINHRTIRVWSEILHKVKNSQFIIDSGNFKDQATQDALKEQFYAHGIESDRLTIGFHSPPWDVLRDIDITLDCFPHNSGTTLFESLYMGIPFITMADRPAMGRLGCTILEGAGHPEWIAYSEDEYIEKAVALATDLPGLTIIRNNLRQELRNSPLMDEPGFARKFEDALQLMFQQWCATSPSAISQAKDAVVDNCKLSRNTDKAITLYNLGVHQQTQKEIREAKNNYIQAINLHNVFIEASNNLGVIFLQEGRFHDAAACFLHALSQKPEYIDAWYNLGNTYKLQHKLLKAEEAYRKTLALQFDHINALYNLGNILQEQGRPEEAETCLRQTLSLAPNHVEAFGTLLYTLNYLPDTSQEYIFQAYKEFNTLFFLPHHADWQPHTNTQLKNRRLRIGYIAPSYCKHPARYFLLPLLAHHDKSTTEIFAYVEHAEDEATNDLFYEFADHWFSTQGLTDKDISDRIRNDAIDVLIDLAGHTAHNRLGVFARKPAPVSLHWLDFGYTTGATAIDYYLTDHITVPEGNERFFSERLWHIQTPALAYRPPDETGSTNALPALQNGFITFGTLTRAVRINHRTIRVWSDIMKKCQGSRLIINSGSFRERGMQEALANRFAKQGITRDRLEIGCTSPPWNVLRKIDIALDCFPHNSGTTLVESLYMGVPYITLADRPSMGRLGASILEGVGHPEWIAATEEEYIVKAVALATDVSSLSSIRTRLRDDMIHSPLMDEQGFAKKTENAFQAMFNSWYTSKLSKDSDHKSKNNKLKKKSDKKPQRTAPSNVEVNELTRLFTQGNHTAAKHLALSLTTRFPQHGFGWKILGPLLYQQGMKKEAIEAMTRATKLSGDVDAHANLGIALEQSGLLAEAEQSYNRAIQCDKNHIQAHYNLANIFQKQNRMAEAEFQYKLVLKINPNFFEAYCNLGNVLKEENRLTEAETYYAQALKLKSDSPEVLYNFGNTLRLQARLPEAIEFFNRALTFNPNLPEAYNNLGVCYKEQGLFSQAEAAYHKAIKLSPNYADAYSNMGSLVSMQSRVHEAEGYLTQALKLNPDQARIHSNLLFTMNYHPDKTAEEIFQHYKDFQTRFGLPLEKEWQDHGNNCNTTRRLKIGYVCPQFCEHPIQYFLEPLLANHDKKNVEVYAYADISREDAITNRYKTYVDHWVPITTLNDVDVTQRIRMDGIDILIDIAGHTGGNRLLVFARKPAPVSLHWLDFGYTTGLSSIDYYLTDKATVPAGSEELFSETPWRIQTPCLVYRPTSSMGEINILPAAVKGYITFGTLTRAVRINHRTIRVWSEILKKVSNSKLMINSGSFQDPLMRKEFTEKFAAHGIDRDQLEIGYQSPPWNVLRQIDIGFDCFPHNSGTTLFENLYMGVPFVTLADRPSIGRLGCSILEGIGHPEWIAKSEDEYIEKAVALAENLPGLATLRASLRLEMQQSPLMDEPAFARKVEDAYKEMFAKWCEEQ